MLQVLVVVELLWSVTVAQNTNGIFSGVHFPGSQKFNSQANTNTVPFTGSQHRNPFGSSNSPSIPISNVFSQRDPFGSSGPGQNNRAHGPTKNPSPNSDIFNFVTSPFHSDQPSFNFGNNGGFQQQQQQPHKTNQGHLGDNIIGNIKPLYPGSNDGFGNLLPSIGRFGVDNPSTSPFDNNRDGRHNPGGRPSDPGSQRTPGSRGSNPSNGHFTDSNNPPGPTIPKFGFPLDPPAPINPGHNTQQSRSPGNDQYTDGRHDPRDQATTVRDPSGPARHYTDQQSGPSSNNDRRHEGGFAPSRNNPDQRYPDNDSTDDSRNQRNPGSQYVDNERDPQGRYRDSGQGASNNDLGAGNTGTNQGTPSDNGGNRNYPDESNRQGQTENSHNYPDSKAGNGRQYTDPNASQDGPSGQQYMENQPQRQRVDPGQEPSDGPSTSQDGTSGQQYVENQPRGQRVDPGQGPSDGPNASQDGPSGQQYVENQPRGQRVDPGQGPSDGPNASQDGTSGQQYVENQPRGQRVDPGQGPSDGPNASQDGPSGQQYVENQPRGQRVDPGQGPSDGPNASQDGPSGQQYVENQPQGQGGDPGQGPSDGRYDPSANRGTASTGGGDIIDDTRGSDPIGSPTGNGPAETNGNTASSGDATSDLDGNGFPNSNEPSNSNPLNQAGNQADPNVGSQGGNAQSPDDGTNLDGQNTPVSVATGTGVPAHVVPHDVQPDGITSGTLSGADDSGRTDPGGPVGPALPVGPAATNNPTDNQDAGPVDSVAAQQDNTPPADKGPQPPPVKAKPTFLTSLPGLNPLDFIPAGFLGKSKCYKYKDLSADYAPSTSTFEYPEEDVIAEMIARPFLAPILGYLNFEKASNADEKLGVSAKGNRQHEHLYSENVYPTGYKAGAFDMAIPKGFSCRTTPHALRMFDLYNGRCWTVNPDYQKVSYTSCSAPGEKCGQCADKNSKVISRCSENYGWVKVWAYCEKARQEQKIRHIRLYLPTGCSCKSYYC